jgi:microcystin-dependent protein
VQNVASMGDVFLTASLVVPQGGIRASGQLLPIVQNTALFSLLGNRFGGDGVISFALPDLRSAAPDGLTYWICIEGLFPPL